MAHSRYPVRGQSGILLKPLRSLHRGKRRAAGTGSQLGKSLLRHISSFLGGRKGVLDLPVLGQVQGSNLLSFLNLLLVGLDLALQLVNETLHALMVLPVLILLVSQFLDLALRLPHTLLCISHPPVLSIKLRFKLPDSGVHLAHGLLSSLEGVLLSIIKSGLKVLDLGFKKLAVTLKTHSTFLLATKLISKAGSINHGLLGLVLRKGSLSRHLIQISR